MLLELSAIVIGYLFGSIPTAYIIARLRKGVDIRDVDVGNVGAGNTFRQIGIWEGAVVTVVDVGKGVAAILIARTLGVSEPWVLGAGFAAVLGHSYPFSIGFRGGQGAATIMGIFFVLAPESMAIIWALIGIILFSKRHMFFERIFFAIFCTAPLLPLLIWLFGGSLPVILYSIAIILFVIFRNRHRPGEMKGAPTGNTKR